MNSNNFCRCCEINKNKEKMLLVKPRVTRRKSCSCVHEISDNNRIKGATRRPLAEIKDDTNVQCCSTTKNCSGAIKKVTDPKVQHLHFKRRAPLAVSTFKKNSIKSLVESTTNITTKSTKKITSSTSSTFSVITTIPQKSISTKQKIYETGKSCESSILDSSSHTLLPIEAEIWLGFNTNIIDAVSDQIIIDGILSLKKKNLQKQKSISSGYKGVVNLDPYTNKLNPSVLYSAYFIDIIKNIIGKEEQLKIDKVILKLSNTLTIYRAAVINWLIKLDQFLNSDASVFYICIRLFDKLLLKTNIPLEFLQLTGMITYWIANKYDNSAEFLTVRTLQEMSCHRYSSTCIINYERRILNILNFDISIQEPIIFVRYYIYLLQVENSNDMSFCSNYLLDCLATSLEINTFPLSMQACGAVYLSLQFLGNDLNIWQKLEFYPGFYRVMDLHILKQKILERLLLIQNKNYAFQEIYKKYASIKYNHISIRVFEGVNNLE